ncbi:MAG: PorT family protein [Pseudoflavonifractor sp.]|nr:PorT family protein [Alloprevotella sp.]MCM1117448.1 PorT family protein [Pseudoflavonifractor sp.]
MAANRLRILLAALLISLAGALPAAAQFKIGPKAGVTVNSLHFDRSVLDSDNRAGFTGGLMCEFTLPVVGVGFDLSALYTRRSAQWMEANDVTKDARDYFAIPLNLKWKLKLPIVRPFLTTGPEVAFLTSRKAVNEAWRNHAVDWSWNFGAGLELMGHLQVAASYGIGINNAVKKTGIADNAAKVAAKNRVWTITAAYLF